MLKLFLAQLGIEALVKCIEGCLSWAFFATPSGQAILTKLLESKDFTVTLAVQLLCGPFGSNAHKPAGQAILTKLLESKDFTVTLAVKLLRGNFGSNAHTPAGVQMFNSVYQHLIRLHTPNLPQVLVSILTTKLCILKISTAAENLLVNCRPGNVEDVIFVAKFLRANFTSEALKRRTLSFRKIPRLLSMSLITFIGSVSVHVEPVLNL